MEQFAIKCKNANIPIRVAGGGESSGGRGDLAAAGRVLDRIEGAEPDATGVVAGNPVRHTHGVPLGKKRNLFREQRRFLWSDAIQF